ncbi:sigma-E processing peptidase SpoIIGA [Desulforamulus ferrireducens]|uniref:Sporulation sigma-E factor-processing peptidase n=1 Tax=Desulforamulus ferrireducens TaxID=1833852 RepID=A0A1S6IU45_9FIRM|nr:sigma-E processing peptidase SpoIIGA [Desulforamulus ferrireducens]AQS58297.1 sigma-E processing peptidase SpoIIGA [Desulforamulus ferrireducens]
MRQVVYLDEVLIVNLAMNLTALWLTSRFTGCERSLTRLLAGAAVGCIYAFLLLWPGWEMLLHIMAKILAALLMVLITFGYGNLKSFVRRLGYLFLSSFCLGGIALGLHYLGQSTALANPLLGDFNKWAVLSGTIGIALILGHWGVRKWHKLATQMTTRVPLTITLWGKKVSLSALVDTGNQLIDPLSQHPVIIIEYQAIKDVLPPELCSILSAGNEDNILSLANTPFANRVRLIPFHSLGRDRGMLLGIRPDEVEIQVRDKIQKTTNVVVGVYHQQLSPEQSYQALLHPELLAA